MNLYIIATALPPQVDGIGDYTARLAAELAGSACVTLLTSQGQSRDPIPGVLLEPLFSVQDPPSVGRIARRVENDRPDWVLLQYNPFSYGRWGLNLHLPAAMRRIKCRCAGTKIALMVHEPFVPVDGAKSAIITVWQRWQLWRLGRDADVIFFSIDPWVRRFRPWFPGKPVLHLPVGSNIPRVPMPRQEARARLGIPDGTLVLGLFGTARAARALDWVRHGAQAVRGTGRDLVVLYVGPHREAVARSLTGLPVLSDGCLPAGEVSRRFAAMDVYLAPYVDGVSTRRTSLMTGLQHGVATVGTRGELTDDVLIKENGSAFLLAGVDAPGEFPAHLVRLAADGALRQHLGQGAQALYQSRFSWATLAGALLEGLGAAGR